MRRGCCFPALVRDKIYPHAVNAIAVGKSPRYMTPKEADAGAVDRSYISVLVQGDRPIVPAAAPVMLVLSVSCRRRFVGPSGFRVR